MKTTRATHLTSATYEELVREMIVRLGEDPDREGLVRTPARVEKAMQFLVKGYKDDPEALLRKALFTVTYDEMVIVKDIEMFSLCEHHMLPFFGKVHVAYIPNGKVIGLSKIPRLIEVFLAPPADPGAPDHANCREPSRTRSNRRASAWSSRRAISA
jgi:GTP cyclohydrolase IA